jgi:transcriptional regulator with XRE-family HTH domain
MDKKKFGSYIKESRLKKNYTQHELADLLFVDVTTVSKWERGVSYPDITLVPDICRVLDISEHELIESSRDEEYRKIKKDAKRYNNMKIFMKQYRKNKIIPTHYLCGYLN